MLGNRIYVKYSLFSELLGYIRLLGTFVNSSCDIKTNIKIVYLAVRGLKSGSLYRDSIIFTTEKDVTS